MPLSSQALKAPTLEEAAILDVATTVVALSEGHRELNPLGLGGATIIKLIVIPHINSIQDETQRKDAQNIASSLWTAAAVNNMGVLFHLDPIICVSIGIITYLELRK